MSAKKAIWPLAEALRQRSYHDLVMQPHEFRNLATGLEDMAARIDAIDTRLSVTLLVVGVIVGIMLRPLFGG